MAYDLILGKISRRWNTGFELPPDSIRLIKTSDVRKMAEKLSSDIDLTAKRSIRLIQRKQLPEAERQAFRKFYGNWIKNSDRSWKNSDHTFLENAQKINEGFGLRWSVFEKVAVTPLQATKALAVVPPKKSLSITAWLPLMGLGLLMGGVWAVAAKGAGILALKGMK